MVDRSRFSVLLAVAFLGCFSDAFAPLQNAKPSRIPTRIFSTEGFVKTVSKPGSSKQVNLGDIATVKYTCYLADDEKAAPFARAERQKMVVGDGTMVKGWEKALRTMSVGERAIVRVTDPELGYGSTGVPPLIPPNAQLEFDIEVLDTQLPTANIDFDSLANSDNTPRTASEIQAAYEQRQALKAMQEPAKEGLEGFIEKAKNFYFFGFFEGETGEEAPWILQPTITFPLAFLVVGAAFYVSYVSGAISERGASVTDELDEVILSSIANPVQTAAVYVSFLGLEL